MSNAQNVKYLKCQIFKISNVQNTEFFIQGQKNKNNKTQIMFDNKRIQTIQIYNLFHVGHLLPSHLKNSLAILLVVCIFCFCRKIHLRGNQDAKDIML